MHTTNATKNINTYFTSHTQAKIHSNTQTKIKPCIHTMYDAYHYYARYHYYYTYHTYILEKLTALAVS